MQNRDLMLKEATILTLREQMATTDKHTNCQISQFRVTVNSLQSEIDKLKEDFLEAEFKYSRVKHERNDLMKLLKELSPSAFASVSRASVSKAPVLMARVAKLPNIKVSCALCSAICSSVLLYCMNIYCT